MIKKTIAIKMEKKEQINPIFINTFAGKTEYLVALDKASSNKEKKLFLDLPCFLFIWLNSTISYFIPNSGTIARKNGNGSLFFLNTSIISLSYIPSPVILAPNFSLEIFF